MMYLRPCVPNKPIETITQETVPVWIKLPGLGLQYFTLQALSKLGSLIGRPLFADKDTIDQSRLSCARMCVEIKADDDEKLPDVIVFQNEFGVDIVQDVEYEWVPPRCTFCKLFGHDTDLCTRHCVPDLDAQANNPDRKSEQLENITAENEEVELLPEMKRNLKTIRAYCLRKRPLEIQETKHALVARRRNIRPVVDLLMGDHLAMMKENLMTRTACCLRKRAFQEIRHAHVAERRNIGRVVN